jgi:hypothetical protein
MVTQKSQKAQKWVLLAQYSFRGSLCFSQFFAINNKTVSAMGWDCENVRKGEKVRKGYCWAQ